MKKRVIFPFWLLVAAVLVACDLPPDSVRSQLTPTATRPSASVPDTPVPAPSDLECEGRIAFIFRDGGKTGIYTVRADGGERTEMVADPGSAYSLAWSPDGTRVLYVAQKDGKFGVYTADSSGQAVSTGFGGYESDPSWSADGEQILLVARSGLRTGLYVVDVGGGEARELTGSASHKTGPAWSPDGVWIAFTMLDGYNQGDVWVMPAPAGAGGAAGEAMNLTQNPAHDCCVAWAPDGTRLAFLSSRADEGVRPAGGGSYAAYRLADMLVRTAYEASPLAEADIPRPLTTVMSEQPRDIYLMARDGSNLINLTSGQGREKDPAWSPDGSRLAFVSDRDGNQEIYVVNADGSDEVRLTRSSEDEFHPVWSPDGACLAFVSYRDSAYGIYLLPVPTEPGAEVGEPWKVVDGGTSGGGLDWAP